MLQVFSLIVLVSAVVTYGTAEKSSPDEQRVLKIFSFPITRNHEKFVSKQNKHAGLSAKYPSQRNHNDTPAVLKNVLDKPMNTVESEDTPTGNKRSKRQIECIHCGYVYKPVCGQDGETYENWCLMDCAGVELQHPGRCTTAWRRRGAQLNPRRPNTGKGCHCVAGSPTTPCGDICYSLANAPNVCGVDDKIWYKSECHAICIGVRYSFRLYECYE